VVSWPYVVGLDKCQVTTNGNQVLLPGVKAIGGIYALRYTQFASGVE